MNRDLCGINSGGERMRAAGSGQRAEGRVQIRHPRVLLFIRERIEVRSGSLR